MIQSIKCNDIRLEITTSRTVWTNTPVKAEFSFPNEIRKTKRVTSHKFIYFFYKVYHQKLTDRLLLYGTVHMHSW